jgi:REP element-mobilizing transposase RayT
MREPLAYFITFTTYGTWLHGRAPGSVDRAHNTVGTDFLPPNPGLEAARRALMRQEPYLLDAVRRETVLKTIVEVAAHRKWQLWAAHVRSNHVHVLVTACDKPEKVMADLKSWASRRLRETCGEDPDRDCWTQHGSTRWINDEASFLRAVQYVVREQGEEMACFQAEELRSRFPGLNAVAAPPTHEPEA